MAVSDVSGIVQHMIGLSGSPDVPKGTSQSAGINLSEELQEGYVVSPPVECKLEVDHQDKDFDLPEEVDHQKKDFDLPSSAKSSHGSPGHDVYVKQELISSCDGNSSESPDCTDGLPVESCIVGNEDAITSVPCAMCGFVVTSLDELREHQSVCQLPVGRSHKCNICSESFERKLDLSNHIICHQVRRPHACRTCGCLFRRKADLQNHMVVHSVVSRPHKCPVCDAEFQRHSSLTNHMKIHNYSPGRALFPLLAQNAANNANSSAVSRVINEKLSQTLPPERSKEPIPSFETLPAPSYSFQHFMNSTNQSNSGSNWGNPFLNTRTSSVIVGNGKVLNVSSAITHSGIEQPGLEDNLPVIHSTFQIASEDAGTPLPCLPDLNSVESGGSAAGLQASFQFGGEQQHCVNSESDAQDIIITDPAFLSVKQVGLLYGIKMEDNFLSPQLSEQKSVRSEEEINMERTHQGEQQQQTHQNPCHLMETRQQQMGIHEMEITADLNLKNKPHICTKCNVRFTRLKAFQCHMRLHNENWDTPQMCPHCLCTFSDTDALNIHSTTCPKSVQNEDKATLPPNQTMEDSDVQFSQTLMQNKTSFKHICPECDKKFATKQKLFRHMWIHRKKQFTCETCGLMFADRAALDGHRVKSHPPNTTRFGCQECGKSFASRQSLWEHGRIHGGSEAGGAALLWCQECNKSFASRQGYQIHIRTHTGERPYGCRYCWKSFRDGGTLRKHERIHTGERPHACPICSRAFNQKVVLREHVRWVHAAATTGDPPHPCQICNALLCGREELCAHIVKHSDDLAAVARAAAKDSFSVETNVKNKTPSKKSNVSVPTYDGKFVSVSTADIEKVSSNNAVAMEYLQTVKAAQSATNESSCVTSMSQYNPELRGCNSDLFRSHSSSFIIQNSESLSAGSPHQLNGNPTCPITPQASKITSVLVSNGQPDVAGLPSSLEASSAAGLPSVHSAFLFDEINTHLAYLDATNTVINNGHELEDSSSTYIKHNVGLNELNRKNRNIFTCDMCEKQFQCKKALLEHVAVHI